MRPAADRAGADAAPGALPLLAAGGARESDRTAVAAGATWAGLMERAAGHLARGVVAAGGAGYGLRVAVLVGKGNNGGDGWAAARRLRDLGASAWVVAVPGAEVEVSDEAAANRRRWIDAGGRTSSGPGDVDAALAWCDVAVDALLGTGISGAPRGDVGEACRALVAWHGTGGTVVACDIPSGVGSDDGSAPDGAVVADLTVTFGALKRGLVLHPGAAHAGRVVVGDLGREHRAPDTLWASLTARGAAPAAFAPSADKRARGVVLVVAGARGTSGAAALSGMAALQAGAGLVTVATPAPVRSEVAGHEAALMTVGLPANDDGELATGVSGALPDLQRFQTVVAGPGLGYGDGAAELVAALRGADVRLVLDADALSVHRDDPSPLADHRGALVLTPHSRELARIGGGDDVADTWANRVERVPELAARYDATIVAKGPGTLVAAPDGRVWVNPTGSSALGSGGTGDVLSGMVGAAIATAADVPLAVARAVWLHGLAGQLAAADTFGRATAGDVLAAVPQALVVAAELGQAQPTWPFTLGWTALAADRGGWPA